jgi:hypothetical protein
MPYLSLMTIELAIEPYEITVVWKLPLNVIYKIYVFVVALIGNSIRPPP